MENILVVGENMAEMVDYKEVVTRLEAEIKPKLDVITAINDLSRIYPDLKVYVPEGMPSTFMVASASANAAVSGYDLFEYPMGKDEAGFDLVEINVWPYAMVNGSKVYSVPMAYKLGIINARGWGVIPMENTLDQMWDDKIPYNPVIRSLKEYLASKPPITYLA
jgi:hypothetical protein